MRPAAIICAFALWTVAAFFAGYKLRDYRAATATQTAQTDAQAARADAVADARTNDHDNAQQAAHGEQARIERAATQAAHFHQLNQDIDAYAYLHSTRGNGRGSADAEFMRIWNEANAGAYGHAAEYHAAAVADAGTEDAAAGTQR